MGRIPGVTAAGTRERLLADALRTHGRGQLADLFAAEPDMPITALLLLIGRRLPRRPDTRAHLTVEALVAARREEDLARPMRDYPGDRAGWLAGLMRLAQAGGELDPELSPDALAHFCLLLALGSALVPPDLHPVGEQEWGELLTRVVAGLAPAGLSAQAATPAQAGTPARAGTAP